MNVSRPTAVVTWRIAALVLAATITLGAAFQFLEFADRDGLTALDIVRVTLFAVTGFWLVWGTLPAIIGILAVSRRTAPDPAPLRGRTVILVPIYNEDPYATFSRIAAMNRGLVTLGLAEKFHFAILSDSTDLSVIGREALAYDLLMREPEVSGRVFYRRRKHNVGKKAGNIEDFVSRSGAAYDYALVLDADSLMAPETIVELALRMDAEPDLGLLQTVPRIIGAQTVFGRMMQFCSAYLSPIYARGAALFHGTEGPYWGHNAIIRMRAFASCCGLPQLAGKPPFGGHILSHDYVEAALLSRAGWRVAVAPDLLGTYEEGPENLIEYAKRDRRWCQGNLQHRRLLLGPGFKLWSRFTLLQGIMSYLVSPLWLVLMLVSIFAAVRPPDPDGDGIGFQGMPVWGLAAGVAVLLIVPKLFMVLRGALDGTNARFGGSMRVLAAMLAEIVFSTLMAPAMLLLQTRAIIQIIAGRDGGWPATRRGVGRQDFATAYAATWWIALVGAATLAIVSVFALDALVWVLPASLPALWAPVIVWAGGRLVQGRAGTQSAFLMDAELDGAPIIGVQRAIHAQWQHLDAPRSGIAISEDQDDVAVFA